MIGVWVVLVLVGRGLAGNGNQCYLDNIFPRKSGTGNETTIRLILITFKQHKGGEGERMGH